MMRPMGREDRALRPFWLHQGAEYLLGLVLVGQGVQSPTPTWPALAGGLVVLNAALVDGPLGAFRAVSRRLHRWLDVIVIAALVAVAALPFLDIDNTSRLLLAGVAVILAARWWTTRFEKVVVTRREGRVGDAAGFAGRLVGSAARRVRDKNGS